MASRYQIVCMVVDRGSLKGAADELGYTQSAVSQAGPPWRHRLRALVLPTHVGMSLLPH